MATAVVPVASLAAVKMMDPREEEKNQTGATRESGRGERGGLSGCSVCLGDGHQGGAGDATDE